MYTLKYKNGPGVDATGKADITVAVGTTNSTATSLVFTGKGVANYGKIQQENLIRLLENFADTTAPTNPTIGQLWYDHSERTLKVLVQKTPTEIWQELNGLQVTNVGAPAPSNPLLGDLWFERTGSGSGFLYTYTGLGRYPTTATTIGGWDQIWPQVETYAGREEYDIVREQVERLAGSAVGAFGSGAITRAITNLTNFAALDTDLRTKYKALAADSNVLSSSFSGITQDRDITRQAPSTTAFYIADTVGTAQDPSEGSICGATSGVPTVGTAGSTLLDGATLALPAGTCYHSQAIEDGFIVYDATTPSAVLTSTAGAGIRYFVIRNVDGQWQYDNNTAWTNFTPNTTQYVIGNISSVADTGTGVSGVLPGDISAMVWAHAVPLLSSTRAKYEHLKVEPNSQDWDALLAAAKYAINRLEVPASFVKSIAAIPFVVDGRQARSDLLALASTDVRFPSAARRASRKGAVIAQVQAFAETMNAISTSIVNRFSIRGINGALGTNPSFGATITTTTQAAPPTTGLSAVLASGSGSVTFRFRFTNQDELLRFVGSGGALQVELTHTGGANAGDTNTRALLTNAGNWRFTGDKTRIFGQSLPLTMTQAATPVGLLNANSAGVPTTTVTISGVSLSCLLSRPALNILAITVTLNAGSALAGSTAVTFKVISDGELNGAVQVYPKPLVYAAGDIVDPL